MRQTEQSLIDNLSHRKLLRPIKRFEGKLQSRIYLKLFFLLFLLIFGLVIFRFSMREDKEKSDILGKSDKIKKIDLKEVTEKAEKTFSEAKESLESTGGEVLGSFIDTVNDIASTSAETFKNFVFDKAFQNLTKELDKLPPQQREKLKDYLCR